MKILIAAATTFEIAGLLEYLNDGNISNVEPLITGIGMTAAAFALTQSILEAKPDFVLQAGVAGAFDKDKYQLGDLVLISEEIPADLGVEDKDVYRDVFDIELMNENEFPFRRKRLHNPLQGLTAKINLPQAKGITINTVSGHLPTIKMRREKYMADIESMEGAALHYVCLQMNIPFAQVRAISNYVEPRDKSKWQMKKAITNLNEWLVEFAKVQIKNNIRL